MMRSPNGPSSRPPTRADVRRSRPVEVYRPHIKAAKQRRQRRRSRQSRLLRTAAACVLTLLAYGARERLSASASTRCPAPAYPAAPHVAAGPTAVGQTPARACAPAAPPPDRIAAFVHLVQPRRGAGYARRLSRLIRSEARRNDLPPLVVAATAYVESEFRSASGPCIGVMQVHPANVRWLSHGEDLDPDKTADNVALGARELAAYYHTGGRTRSLRHTWGRYNGCGPGGEYVERALRVLHRLRAWDEDGWRRHLRTSGPLWDG